MAPLKVKVALVSFEDQGQKKSHFGNYQDSSPTERSWGNLQETPKNSASISKLPNLSATDLANSPKRKKPKQETNQEEAAPSSPMAKKMEKKATMRKREEEQLRITKIPDEKPVEQVTEVEERLRLEMEKRIAKSEKETAYKKRIYDMENEKVEKKKEMMKLLLKKEYTMADDGSVILLLKPNKREKNDGKLPSDVVEMGCVSNKRHHHETPLDYVKMLELAGVERFDGLI